MSILLYDDTSLITSPEIRKKQETDLLAFHPFSFHENTVSSIRIVTIHGLCCAFVMLSH